jgi:hypothetical protein
MSSYITIHPLSKLPYNISREKLAEKYGELLELYYSIKNEVVILRKENKYLTNENNKLREQYNRELDNDFNLPIEDINIKDYKIVNNNNIKNINIINIKGDKTLITDKNPIIDEKSIIDKNPIIDEKSIIDENPIIDETPVIKANNPIFDNSVNIDISSITINEKTKKMIVFYQNQNLIKRIKEIIYENENIGYRKITKILLKDNVKYFKYVNNNENKNITPNVIQKLIKYIDLGVYK